MRTVCNKVWDQSRKGKITWTSFVGVLEEYLSEHAGIEEDRYKETFRVFSKNDEGCIPMEEIKFVLSQVCPEKVRTDDQQILKLHDLYCLKEVEDIALILDKNGDGFISYTEFKYMMGGT